MGKRSDFERLPKDKYRTPVGPIEILIPHLVGITRFIEPCAGDYRLARTLEELTELECVYACDIDPDDDEVTPGDALAKDFRPFLADAIITNPPWDRELLHPMIIHFANQMPTWLLFDSDWAHTIQAAHLMDKCSKVVSVGRVKWIEDSTGAGKDNCSWYRFDAQHSGGPQFVPRLPKGKVAG